MMFSVGDRIIVKAHPAASKIGIAGVHGSITAIAASEDQPEVQHCTVALGDGRAFEFTDDMLELESAG